MKERLQSTLLDILACPGCGGGLIAQDGALVSPECGYHAAMHGEIPLFTEPPQGLRPSEKLVRGPEVGTPWRRANWRFLANFLAGLPTDAVILDVGAGRGDFADLLAGRRAIALDIYPYPEVDVVCDLTLVNPLRSGSLDAILLLNVLEHVYDAQTFLLRLAQALKPGGALLVAIPFMVKMHQVPVDFARYTHFALQRLGSEHGLQVEVLEGFYDPLSVLGEGMGNLKHQVLPEMHGARHYAARVLLAGITALAGLLGRIIGPGSVRSPQGARSLAPTGYQIIYRKPLG